MNEVPLLLAVTALLVVFIVVGVGRRGGKAGFVSPGPGEDCTGTGRCSNNSQLCYVTNSLEPYPADVTGVCVDAETYRALTAEYNANSIAARP
jgi:hypothetical protein